MFTQGLASQSSVLLTFSCQVPLTKGKVGDPQQRQYNDAVFSAIVILIRTVRPLDALICNLGDELTSETQSGQLL